MNLNSIRMYQDVNLSNPEVAQLVQSLTNDRIKKRRFNIRETLNRQNVHQLTGATKEIAEFIFQLCEQKNFQAVEVGQEWIGRRLRRHRDTVNVCLQYLEKIGLIKIHRRELGFTHQYQFNIPEWLKSFISKVPKFIKKKHLFGGGVSDLTTQSNVDLPTYIDYLNFKDSKDEKLRIFGKKNPGDGGSPKIMGQSSEVWSAAHRSYVHKEVAAAPKEFLKQGMASLRAMLKL